MPPAKEAGAPVASVGEVGEDVHIDRPVVTVRLPVARTGAPAERLRQALAAPAGRARAELVLDGIEITRPPGVQFNVYLSLGEPQPARQYVGTLSFYGVNPRTGSGKAPRRTFDVTQELKALRGKSPAALSGLQVVFEATEGTAGSKPEDAGALLDREAGLRIGSIELRVAGL